MAAPFNDPTSSAESPVPPPSAVSGRPTSFPIPPEQTEQWSHTKLRVGKATAFVFGTTGDIAETHKLAANVLGFDPIPRLAAAAKILLNIWDTLQLLDTNRFACLRLTERCADILCFVRQEIKDGDSIGEELATPINTLEESFKSVLNFLHMQANRPFIKRYLKRDEILDQIRRCNASLSGALGMFGLPIQIRVLRRAQDAEHQRQRGTQLNLDPNEGILHMRHASPIPVACTIAPGEVLPKIRELHETQNMHDIEQDLQDIYALLRAALSGGSDVEIFKALQIHRGDVPEAVKTLQRAVLEDNTIHREFIESGIDALKRMSVTLPLPSWTITRHEVDRGEKIGLGFASDIYKGTWRGLTVAIRVLAPSIPRELFRREITIWKMLKHENVCALYGASSASGDPPWFFVSPYQRNGSLVRFLKNVAAAQEKVVEEGLTGVAASGSCMTVVGRDGDLFRYMLEIAKGMEYLHANRVLHGDLKATNVLVDDNLRCVITDYGQSEMKVYRIGSEMPLPHGALRWQAPELMECGSSQLSVTPQVDVYSYAILCVEILGMGSLPWPLMDDEAVRHFVLIDNVRPPLPISPFKTPSLQDLLGMCWHRDPRVRPTFATIVQEVKGMRKNFSSSLWGDGAELSLLMGDASPRFPPRISLEGELPTRFSPNMGPGPLSSVSMQNSFSSPLPAKSPGNPTSLGGGTLTFPGASPHHVKGLEEEPQSHDERASMMRDEETYRLLLDHPFHPSLTLPLWTPSRVELGAVGYLSRSSSSFVTLFNSLSPEKAMVEAARGLPSLYGYGKVITGRKRQDKKAIFGFLTLKRKVERAFSRNVTRRYSFPLRAGHKAAYMYTETTIYHYIEQLDVPKKWFKANVDVIMRICGPSHDIQREDIYVVIGTLDTPDYALFVSHNHPNGQAYFNVDLAPRIGQPWGVFTINQEVAGGPPCHGGAYTPSTNSSRVSDKGNGPWDTVLIARLRFKPDVTEPTSL